MSIFISTLDGSEWSSSLSGRFTPRYPRDRRLHGLREKEESLFRLWELRPNFLVAVYAVYVSSLISGLSYIGAPLNA
jgi:hypothetical protein